jgi:hypothetical protein
MEIAVIFRLQPLRMAEVERFYFFDPTGYADYGFPDEKNIF